MQNELKNLRPQIRSYICLGSNIGDRVGFIQQAMQLFKDIPRLGVVECSSLYETEPIGQAFIEWFVNAVVAIDTDLSSDELHDVCKDIEARLSELPETHPTKPLSYNVSKIIDIDILLYGQQSIESVSLTIPHPLLHKRAFALVPLLEIAPDLVHPVLGQTMAQLHEALAEPEQVYLYGTRGFVDDNI